MAPKPKENAKPAERPKVWLLNKDIPRRLAHTYFENSTGTVVSAGVSAVDEDIAAECMKHWPNDFELVDGPGPAPAPAAAPASDPNVQRENETLEQFAERMKAQKAAGQPA